MKRLFAVCISISISMIMGIASVAYATSLDVLPVGDRTMIEAAGEPSVAPSPLLFQHYATAPATRWHQRSKPLLALSAISILMFPAGKFLHDYGGHLRDRADNDYAFADRHYLYENDGTFTNRPGPLYNARNQHASFLAGRGRNYQSVGQAMSVLGAVTLSFSAIGISTEIAADRIGAKIKIPIGNPGVAMKK